MTTTRVTTTTVTFVQPFILDDSDELQPAGSYTVDTGEEALDTLSLSSWKRTSTVMHLSRQKGIEHMPLDPEELNEALRRDAGQQDPTAPVSSHSPKGRHDRARRPLALMPRER